MSLHQLVGRCRDRDAALAVMHGRESHCHNLPILTAAFVLPSGVRTEGTCCPLGVNRVGLAMYEPLPLYPSEPMFAVRISRSERCQYRKVRARRCSVGRSSETILAFNPTERGTYGCERTDVRQMRCSVPCRTRRLPRARALAENSTSGSLCRTRRDPLLRQRRQCVFELR